MNSRADCGTDCSQHDKVRCVDDLLYRDDHDSRVGFAANDSVRSKVKCGAEYVYGGKYSNILSSPYKRETSMVSLLIVLISDHCEIKPN